MNVDVGVLSPEEAKALETLKILNPIITLSAERLDGLRTQCATNAEITHQEIRTLEVIFNKCKINFETVETNDNSILYRENLSKCLVINC